MPPQTHTQPPGTAAGALWGETDFLWFWAGQGVSSFGSQVTDLALPLAAMAVYGASAQQVGWLRFVELAPYLFLSLPFGVWVDRSRRRPVMVAANAGRMMLLASVPLMAHLGLLPAGGLVAVAATAGVLAVVFDVAWASYLPTLVANRQNLVEANQKLGVTQSTTDLAGPGVAGLLIGWLGALPDPTKLDEFERFARAWMRLVDEYGGVHHGYFLPGEGASDAAARARLPHGPAVRDAAALRCRRAPRRFRHHSGGRPRLAYPRA